MCTSCLTTSRQQRRMPMSPRSPAMRVLRSTPAQLLSPCSWWTITTSGSPRQRRHPRRRRLMWPPRHPRLRGHPRQSRGHLLSPRRSRGHRLSPSRRTSPDLPALTKLPVASKRPLLRYLPSHQLLHETLLKRLHLVHSKQQRQVPLSSHGHQARHEPRRPTSSEANRRRWSRWLGFMRPQLVGSPAPRSGRRWSAAFRPLHAASPPLRWCK